MALTTTDELASVEAPPLDPASPRRKIRRTVVATVVALAVVLGGGGVAYARWDADQNAQLAAARSALEAANADAVAAEDAAHRALDASEGKVADNAVRVALLDLLSRSSAGWEVPRGQSRSVELGLLRAARASAEPWTEEIIAATAAVVTAHAAWEIDQAKAGYEQAATSLGAAIDAATAVLSGSEGRVADNAVRQALADAIAAADTLRTSSVPTEVDALTGAATAIAAATATTDTARTAVTDAQTAWQAEQDRIAAEQAAAAQAAAARAAASSNSPKSGGSGSSSSSSKPKSSGSSNSAPKASSGVKVGDSRDGGTVVAVNPDGSYVVESHEQETICGGGDEHGNTWDC